MTKRGNIRRNRSTRTDQQQRDYRLAHEALSNRIRAVRDDGVMVPCVAYPGLYQTPDVPAADRRNALWVEISERKQRCRSLCTGCPALDECLLYAEVARAQDLVDGDYLPTPDLLENVA